MTYPGLFWAYRYFRNKWLNVKWLWSSIGLNPWKLHFFHVFEWFDITMFFSLENNLFLGLNWRNIAFKTKYQCKEMHFSFFWASEFGHPYHYTGMKIPLDTSLQRVKRNLLLSSFQILSVEFPNILCWVLCYLYIFLTYFSFVSYWNCKLCWWK